MIEEMFLPFFINFLGNLKPDLVIFEQLEMAALIESFKEKSKKKKRKKDPEAEVEEEPRGIDLSKLNEEQSL